ncbi:DASS family sodium-coupled anion symporter [Bermanella marisrubri]|uniref:Putative transport protein n=1 Tax=Bermanella marisrubri TaxID=207949 RepID=Q1N3D3_9GAMM|nr:DASS family sodium-coupled anion symporter [Bermanella marisrubri]EAT12658.1 putative transport protein [Oceanobacter sp. RED65] [Bermanella marisrubri]QIZ85217.1 DASS family sodium-coupled anion symporter [Bermanella marisrubri]
MNKPLLIIILPIVSWLLASSVVDENVKQDGLFIMLLAASFWFSQVIHISITALLIPVLAVILGVFDVKSAMAHFAHPIIFLFMGGFALAAALKQHDLDQWLAQRFVKQARGNGVLVCLMMFLVTAFLSMWISNTATVAMMLPIALGLLSALSVQRDNSTYVFVLLGIAYSASIGGIATLVGSPPNAIAGAALGLSFSEWMAIGLPVTLVFLPLMWVLLFVVLKPNVKALAQPHETISIQWTRQRVVTVIIFLITACMWMLGSELKPLIGIEQSYDAWVALSAIILLHVTGCLSFETFEKQTQWSVLLLFGGGLCLSGVLTETGSNEFLANLIASALNDMPTMLMLIALSLFIIFMTEISSNTALAALMVPTFIGISEAMGLSPTASASMVAVAASCAFMLPVATPPNAIVYGSGYVSQSQMIQMGFVLNILAAILVPLIVF